MASTFDRDWARAREARKLRDDGQCAKAIELFTNLLNRYNVSELYFERGTTYSQLGDFDSAVADLTHAIDLESDDPDCYVNRGNAYLKQSQFAAAIKDYDTAIRLSPNLACAHNSRAYAHQQIGQVDDAINGFLYAIELDQAYASPYFNLGALFLEAGRLNDALTYLSAANELIPNDTAVLAALDDVHSQLKEERERDGRHI